MIGLSKSTNFKENDFINVPCPCLNELTKKFETQFYQNALNIIRYLDNYWITKLLNYTHYLALKKQQNNKSINDGVGIIGNRY